MIRNTLVFAASALALVACSSTPEAVDEPMGAEEVLVDEFGAGDNSADMSKFERAMESVNDLVSNGNEQAAIDRIEQMLGTPGYSDDELAEALFRRGQIRISDRGYDAWGAISDLEEVLESYPDSDWTTAAQTELDTARGKATSLNFMKEQASSTRTQKFDAMMQLGEHQEAMDFMNQWNLTPDNDAVVALFQIGYLCEGDTLTGRSFDITEPDGTMRNVRSCDAGK